MEEPNSNKSIFKKYSNPINADAIKNKISNILNLKQYCGICLENGDNMSSIEKDFEITLHQWALSVSLKNIIFNIFSDNAYILASDIICNNCTTKLLQSYIFIENTKTVSRIINTYITDLCSKLGDVNDHLGKTSKLDSSNVVIVLENAEIDCNCLQKSEVSTKDIEKKKIAKNDVSMKLSLKEEARENTFQCVECGITLATFQDWKKHDNKYHRDKNLECKICLKSFKNQQYLLAHYKVHAKVICKICHQIIPDTGLIDHLKEYHQEISYSCDICNEAYYSSKALDTHIKICHENIIGTNQCVMCLNSFKENEFKAHKCKFNCPECSEMPCIHYKYLMFYREQILNHASRAKCLDCDYVCRKKDNLLGHVNREHLDHHPYTCDKCGQQFYSKPLIKAHMYHFHLDTYACEFCDSKFYSNESLEGHKKCCELILREFICDKCSATFDSTEELMKHKRRKHSKEIYPCGLCSKELLTESKRKEHMVKVHSGIQIKNRRLNVKCVVCEEKFDTKGELVHHMRTHGPNATYPCRICDTVYDSLRKLKAHCRKHIGPFAVCEICGKEMRQVLLDKHMSNHGSMGEIVTCDTCGRSFRNIAQLKYHQKVHLDSVPCPKCKKLINPAKLRRHWRGHLMHENPKLKESKKQKPNLKCQLCDYTTWNNILLECHMNRHHLKIKPYICHICSKDFIGKHLLKKHLETHTVDKSVDCMVCGKNFANSACLKMHLRLHTGETPYPCDICGQRFRSSSIMNVHKQKKHSDRSNPCPLCTSKFHTIRDMRRHVIKVHWKQKNKRFDPRELKGLEQHYHLFHDGRRVKVDEKEVEFFMR